MAEGERSGRGCLGRVLFVGILIIILRANLPPNNVAQSLDLGGKSGVEGFFAKIVASEFVADWEYTDLGIIKIARSERLDLSAVGLPFSQWKVFKDE
ncbi:MAG TPA: hypothetical protein VLE27_09180 [Thermoanaerobaculia bacterium]|nr:hypothetical protein [Thermoanaerobaculia bacterium]